MACDPVESVIGGKSEPGGTLSFFLGSDKHFNLPIIGGEQMHRAL